MDADEILLSTEERMEGALENLREKFKGMRTGRANPGLVEPIKVDYYGTPTPLKQMSNISAPEPDLLVIKPYDVSSLGSIEKAIQKSDVGIQPMNDGKVIRLKVPPLSQERRKQLASRAKEVSEEARVSVRNVRRDANKSVDALEKAGGVSEDDLEKLKEEVQNLTKGFEEKIDAALKAKTEELTAM